MACSGPTTATRARRPTSPPPPCCCRTPRTTRRSIPPPCRCGWNAAVTSASPGPTRAPGCRSARPPPTARKARCAPTRHGAGSGSRGGEAMKTDFETPPQGLRELRFMLALIADADKFSAELARLETRQAEINAALTELLKGRSADAMVAQEIGRA